MERGGVGYLYRRGVLLGEGARGKGGGGLESKPDSACGEAGGWREAGPALAQAAGPAVSFF